MKNLNLHSLIRGASSCLLLQLFISSCIEINNDYDLRDDIDKTVEVSVDLTLPTSNTVQLKMKDILDLQENGTVKTIGEDSIYYLIQESDTPSNFEFDLPNIKVSDPTLSPFELTFTIPTLETLLSGFGLSSQLIDLIVTNKNNIEFLETLLGKEEANKERESPAIDLNKGFNVLNYTFSVPNEVIALKAINFGTPMQPDFDLTTTMPVGELGLHSVYAEFPSIMKHNYSTQGGTWSEQLNDQGYHQYNLPQNVWLKKGEHTHLGLEFTGVDMNEVPWERTNNPNGTMVIEESVGMHGKVTVKGTIIDFISLAGESFTLEATIRMKAPSIGDATVMIDPKINPKSTEITLNDLPDFLTENDVTVILKQPAIRLDIYAKEQTSHTPIPVKINCWGTFKTDKGKEIRLGSQNNPSIYINNTINSNWCIYDGESQPNWGAEYNYFKALGLTHIIEQIPNNISIDFSARIEQEFVTIGLGTFYKASIDYLVECPLALGEGSKIIYTETIEDLQKDLEDVEIEEVNITARMLVQSPSGNNDIPFDKIDINVIPLDNLNKELAGINVTPIENANNGDIIELNMTCNNGALQQLDALKFEVAAKVTNKNSVPLSALTTIQLTDISIGIIGGVVVDLN